MTIFGNENIFDVTSFIDCCIFNGQTVHNFSSNIFYKTQVNLLPIEINKVFNVYQSPVQISQWCQNKNW